MAPADLISIAAACSSRARVNTIGVVVDKLDIHKTRGSSYGATFTIKDCDFDTPTWQGGLKVKYFNDNQAVIPMVQVNDVILLRNLRVSFFQGKPTGVASQNDTVYWAIFRPQAGSGGNLSISRGPIAFEPDSNEKKRAAILLANLRGEETPPALEPSPTPAPATYQPLSSYSQASAPAKKWSGLPFSLIQDVKVGRLTQLLGQVVKMNTYDSNKTLIYLTDYTTNTSLIDIRKDDNESGVEGDEYGYLSRKKQNWPGPWGQLSIQVALWEPHASFAREYVKEGSLVHLTYVHVKDDRSGGIEAAVHRDKRFENKIHINIVSDEYDERARDLMERRRAYWKIHGEPSADPRKAEKKAEKQKKNNPKPKEVKNEEGQTILPKPSARTKTNLSIKCRDYGIPVHLDLDSILSAETHLNHISGDVTYKMPFQNVCYRPQVRVVDFYPPNLEDFAVQVPVNSTTGHDNEEEDLGPKYTTWEWCFCLLVAGTGPSNPKQEPREFMKIFVYGGEGTHLLNLDPDDLHNNPDRLNELREKLFILWGNLEERKQQAAATDNGNDESWARGPVLFSAFCLLYQGVRGEV